MEKTPSASRRGFLNSLGVAVGGAGLAAAGLVGGTRIVRGTAPGSRLSRRYQRAGRDYRPRRMRTRAQQT